MKLLLGLGNPGEEYKMHRHNVGFLFIDQLAKKYDIPMKYDKYFLAEVGKNENIILAKPQTFMNRSGESLKQLVIKYGIKPEDVYVIHDDLDIKLGEYKISLGKGPKLHNGLKSIEDHWKTKDFWRIRIGVENRTDRIPGEAYVLSPFSQSEIEELQNVFKTTSENILF